MNVQLGYRISPLPAMDRVGTVDCPGVAKLGGRIGLKGLQT